MPTPVPDGYYHSPHWQAKRRKALAYRNYTCAACGTHWGPARQYMLDVHHTKKAYQNLWRENVTDLFALCGKRAGRKCHKKGIYEAAQIRSDRTANRYIGALNWACSRAWRAVRWAWRKLRAAPPSRGWQ